MKEKVAWKILRRNGENFVSAFIEGKGKVIYQEGVKIYPPKWLSAKGYGICCFGTKEDAEKFIKDFKNLVLKKVQIGKILPLKPFLVPYSLRNGEMVLSPPPILLANWNNYGGMGEDSGLKEK